MLIRDLIWMAVACAAPLALAPSSVRGETLADGLAALKAGSDTMALPQLEEAVRILRARADDTDADGVAHYHLARAYEALAIRHGDDGNAAAAVHDLEQGVLAAKAALERKDASPYHTILGDLYGELAAQSGVVGRMRYGRLAAAAFRRALELDPRNALAHVGAGIGKLETPAMFGGSVVEALAEFHQAQALDPTCDEAWVWEGIAQRRLGAIAAARRAFAKAIAVNPRSQHAKRELAVLEENFR